MANLFQPLAITYSSSVYRRTDYVNFQIKTSCQVMFLLAATIEQDMYAWNLIDGTNNLTY